jgi:hypothetical protein
MQTEKSSTYSPSHRRFYERHREAIREKRKESDHDYYERNKERIKARVLARYYDKKSATTLPASEPNVPNVIYLEIAPDQPADSPAAGVSV